MADARHRPNWKAYVKRESLRGFESLAQVIEELRAFLSRPVEHARNGETFGARWTPGGPWI
jgi:hypothetical protein